MLPKVEVSSRGNSAVMNANGMILCNLEVKSESMLRAVCVPYLACMYVGAMCHVDVILCLKDSF